MKTANDSRQVGYAAAALLSAGALLAGCNNDATDSRSAGQRLDSAIAKTGETLEGLKGEARVAGQEMKQAASGLGDRIESSASDAGVTARVKAVLARDVDLNALKIDVDTAAGRVALKGTAPSLAAKQRATTLAQAVDGVLAVENQLVVAAVPAVKN